MKIRTPRVFRLSKKFLEPYQNKNVPWGPIGYITYKRTYARRLDNNNLETGTEEWWQTCKRVIEGMFTMQKKHCVQSGLPWSDAKAQRTAKIAYEKLFTLKWTPPGRGLWMMGTDFVENKTGAGLFNCAFRSTKDISTKGGYLFQWIMDALMVGIGVGFDTLGAGKLTIIAPGSKFTTPEPLSDPHNQYNLSNDKWICTIADSREGWVESIRILLNAFYYGYELPVFRYNQIRSEGSLIKGFGGIASGPEPLIDLHQCLTKMYSKIIGQIITSENIVDTQNLIGRCVVAGNVRRSAALALGQPNDNLFIQLKNPEQINNWTHELKCLQELNEKGELCYENFYDEEQILLNKINNHPLRHHRWGSNNSIDASNLTNFTEYAQLTVKNGEPGYIFLENARTRGRFKDLPRDDDLKVMGFNPCVEQQLEDGELCCLVETYPWLHDSFEDYLLTLKIAYLYAKTVTLANTQWPETNAIMGKNRRIGLSLSGFIQACEQHGYKEMYNQCNLWYNYVQKLDAAYSDWLCIPRSKRTTSIKPSGTVSKLNGSWPGIHHPEAEFYFQRIRFAEDNDMLPALIAAGYPVENCAYSPRTMVVTFPVQEKHFTRGKKEVSMWEQLEIAAQMQYFWADNSVSVTITFQDHEVSDIPRALELYSSRLKAVSFLRYKETGYVQAPYEACTRKQYEELVSQTIPIQRIKTQIQGEGERFCDGDSCQIDFSKS